MTTIRGRLLAMLLAGLSVVLLAGGAAVYLIARASLVRQFDAGLESRARSLASLVTYERDGLIFDAADAAELMRDTYFQLRTRSGELLRQSANLAEATLPPLPGDRTGIAAGEAGGVAFDDLELPGELHGRAAWLVFWPGDDQDEDERSGTLEAGDVLLAPPAGAHRAHVVTVALDRNPIERAMTTLLGALIAVGGVVGITVALLVAAGVRWGLLPLERLSRQLGGVSGGTISRRFDQAGATGELAPIYEELNRMLDRVEQTLERERSFVDAAAHELRTPLAELRATAEVAVRWPDPARATASLEEMHAIGREMERLVESLLLISRGKATAVEGDSAEVPAASIVPGCIERANGSISEKGLKLAIDLDERSGLRGPRGAMEIIIRNLIDNAVRYTPSHGSITITGGRQAGGPRTLIVENGPVRLVEDDLPRLFEPFWRTDEARSDREHIGLGLTVVDRIAHASGLSVDATLAGDRLQIRVSEAA